jgi:hypothetical protein
MLNMRKYCRKLGQIGKKEIILLKKRVESEYYESEWE